MNSWGIEWILNVFWNILLLLIPQMVLLGGYWLWSAHDHDYENETDEAHT